MTETLSKRFWSKVEIIPFHNCWEWVASKNEFGYGRINLGRKVGIEKAHRVSWMLHFGPIPKGYCVLHACDNPSCVRPLHLFLGTKKDNTQDMIRKGRGRGHFSKGILDPRSNGGKHNKIKTHCLRGHEFNPENTRSSNGRRHCKLCDRYYYEKNKQNRARPS